MDGKTILLPPESIVRLGKRLDGDAPVNSERDLLVARLRQVRTALEAAIDVINRALTEVQP